MKCSQALMRRSLRLPYRRSNLAAPLLADTVPPQHILDIGDGPDLHHLVHRELDGKRLLQTAHQRDVLEGIPSGHVIRQVDGESGSLCWKTSSKMAASCG